MDNSVGSGCGSEVGGLGGGGQRGKNWDNCNSINNKIFKFSSKTEFWFQL